MRAAQENLRLSANQNAKMAKELNEYRLRIDQNNQENDLLKGKMNKLVGENSSLGEEVKNAQESLRLSSATQAKLARELNEYKQKIVDNNQESETYRIKLQKLSAETNALGEEMRGAQENLRLSAGTINKLNNELKITCNENEQLKKQLEETLRFKVRCLDFEEKIVLLSAEIHRLRSNSSSAEN
jgi:chromosome segregation ATPase